MENDLASILREIVEELRIKNEMSRVAAEKAEIRLKEVNAKTDERMAQFGLRLEASGEESGGPKSILDRSRERMATLETRMEAQNDSRRAFQQDLLTELRRINTNLEALITKN